MSLRYESQSVLFAKILSRLDLLEIRLPENPTKIVTINVWRNHAFESLVPLMEPFTLFGNWRAKFHLGSYDDTFMFNDWKPAEIELLWLDNSRFSLEMDFTVWIEWLHGRLTYLRKISNAPTVIATWVLNEEHERKLQEMADDFPGLYYANLKKTCEDAAVKLLDPRTAKLTGSPISNPAQLVIARELACHWLPAIAFPPVKAVAVDLDHTLHCGVLGEDGIDGVLVMPGHRELQETLKSLRQRGIFIALVSRNERVDVEALFNTRQDYPLRWEDFSAVEVSWEDKASALERVSEALRIAPDAVLYVDDNPGELANVRARLPQTHTIYAHEDAGLTSRTISFYPSLWRWKVESDDSKRIQDLKVNIEREILAKEVATPEEYFRSLHVTLEYFQSPREQLTRLADLCGKTNQFNLALRRFSQIELLERMERTDAAVASVRLTDRLSDSGIIAVIVGERVGEQLLVEELCVSCRALGRRLEDTIVLIAIRSMPIFENCQEVAFRVRHGPRNQPVLDWLARLLNLNGVPEPGLHSLPASRLRDFEAANGIAVIME